MEGNLIDNTVEHIVPAEGPVDARIVIVGEAPGETEVKYNRPFCGMSGKVLDGILAETGIARARCYVTNVMQIRPKANKFANFYTKENGKRVASPELLEGIERLKNEIISVKPNVIVALGNEAMKALTGLSGVTDWRGSVIQTPYGKVIPSIHPASVFLNWNFRPAVVCDFNKANIESDSPDWSPTQRELVILYNTQEALNEIKRLRQEKEIAFDIETETDQITCIGFSSDGKRAVSIPFWFGDSGSLRTKEEEVAVWEAIKDLLESEVAKIGHNGAYDIGVLRRTMDIQTNNYSFDTMVGAHAMYLELPKSLAFLTSIYTDQAYYKYMRKVDDMDTQFRYNALDACITFELKSKLIPDLQEFGMLDFYYSHMHPLIFALLDMELRGVRFDCEKRNKLRADYRRELTSLQGQLEKEVGHELNTASHKQMTAWLYDELKLPKQVKLNKVTGIRVVTADEEAIHKLLKKHDVPALHTVLKIRELNKIYTTYLGVKLDEDKRIRCSYNITGTETGRLSSSSTVRGSGTNLQNIPKAVKGLFLADEGKVLVEADLSQAEARVVAYLANEDRLIKVFSNGGDIHRKNAGNIFNKKEEEVTDEERQLAKRVVHASNYGMGYRTFSRQAGIPEREAQRLLNQYFAAYPRIRNWHMQIQGKLKNRRELVTPLGRKRIFYNRWNEQLFKEGLAYIPQSTVADLLNDGLVCLHRKIVDYQLPYELLLQVHDSIVVQCRKEDVARLVKDIRECLYRPLEINGKIMTIPVEFKVGNDWERMEKYDT